MVNTTFSRNKIPLLALVGPTATGKTELSLKLAQRLNGEIISSDSMLIYRGMDIGTAKPSLKEQKLVPHHMIDIVNPDEQYNAALYSIKAKQIITEIYQRGKLPILTGGTGLYVNAVLYGYNFTEASCDSKLREKLMLECNIHGKEALHKKLRLIDPETASQIHKNNVKRIIRALEIYYLSGKTLSESANREKVPIYNLLTYGLCLDRELLYNRIEKRIQKMLDEGLVEEVRGLLEKGYHSKLNSMQGLGYKEIVLYLTGELTLEESISLLNKNTRNFAKRQLTWFRRDKQIKWLDINLKTTDEILREIILATEGVFSTASNEF